MLRFVICLMFGALLLPTANAQTAEEPDFLLLDLTPDRSCPSLKRIAETIRFATQSYEEFPLEIIDEETADALPPDRAYISLNLSSIGIRNGRGELLGCAFASTSHIRLNKVVNFGDFESESISFNAAEGRVGSAAANDSTFMVEEMMKPLVDTVRFLKKKRAPEDE